MAERYKNLFKRQLTSYNPNFRIDTANPQMGLTGTDVYKIYGVTDNGDNQSSISLSSGGLLGLYNDHTIQISGGTKNQEGAEDIVIIGNNGNVSISANGTVRIYATNIMLEAEQDIHLKAGRNISIKGGDGRLMLDSQRVDVKGISGNLISLLGKDFTKQVFAGSFVGFDFLDKAVSGIVSKVIDTVIDIVK
ncbi:hypothetical protein EBU71_09040 [bacterium]|nr:hypothetical protein [Candidatus Elulimicrobium humile]